MATLKCLKCGHDVAGLGEACSHCGAPLATPVAPPHDSHGPGLGTLAATAAKLSREAAGVAQQAANQGRALLKSQEEQDADAVDALARSFEEKRSSGQTESERNRERFKSALDSTIDASFAEIMRGKKDSANHLTFVDGEVIAAKVRNIFRSALEIVPSEVDAACRLGEAVLAPTATARNQRRRAAIGVIGGAVGLALIIMAVADLLGWSENRWDKMAGWFTGTAYGRPMVIGLIGVTIAGLSAYFATATRQHIDSERYLRILKQATGRAVDAIWTTHERPLTEALKRESK